MSFQGGGEKICPGGCGEKIKRKKLIQLKFKNPDYKLDNQTSTDTDKSVRLENQENQRQTDDNETLKISDVDQNKNEDS